MTSGMVACMTPSSLPNRILLNEFHLLCGFSKIRFRTHISIMAVPSSLGCARSTDLTHWLLLQGLIMMAILHLLLIEVQSDER
jgi:hypothetical protein